MRVSIVMLAMLQLVAAAAAQPDQGAENQRLMLSNIRIFDVGTGQMMPAQNIIIEGSTISFVGKIWDAPFRGREIDCRGKFAVPGLFDSHIHMTELTRHGDDSLQSILKAFVERGVMQVRDVGGSIDVVSEMARRIETGEIIGPEMFYTGPMLEKSPMLWEGVNDTFPDFTAAINTIEDVDSLLPTLAEQGARLVKTFNKCDSTVYGHLVEVARQLSLKIVHDPGTPLFHWIPMDKAIEMGVTSIEHAKAPWPVVLSDDLKEEHDRLIGPDADQAACRMFMTKVAAMGTESISLERLGQLAARMTENEVYLCPTLNVLESMEENALEATRNGMGIDTLPEQVEQMIKTSVAGMAAVSRYFVTELSRTRVKMFVGQDGYDPSATFTEMQLMNDCGVSAAEIIKGATIYPAEWLGVSYRLGSIMPGKQANILVVDANPLEDIGNLEQTFLVIKSGSVIYP
ncbi:MAG: amidohydrolase family protein [Candidatus Zixiibacteriota bacterium]|nr:MAG: amidohydrolase family protein [candidate division Zixibacteria bacterium]